MHKAKSLSEISIFCPIKLVSEANRVEHWTKKHRRRRSQKNAVFAAFKNQVGSKASLPVRVTLTRISARKFDYDNLLAAFKAVRDQVADCLIPGLAPGRADDSPLITWEYSQEKPSERGNFGVRILFEFLQ